MFTSIPHHEKRYACEIFVFFCKRRACGGVKESSKKKKRLRKRSGSQFADPDTGYSTFRDFLFVLTNFLNLAPRIIFFFHGRHRPRDFQTRGVWDGHGNSYIMGCARLPEWAELPEWTTGMDIYIQS